MISAVAQNNVEAIKNVLSSTDDNGIVCAALIANGYELKFAKKHFQSDKNMVLLAVQHNGTAIRFASKQLQDDRDIVLTVVF